MNFTEQQREEAKRFYELLDEVREYLGKHYDEKCELVITAKSAKIQNVSTNYLIQEIETEVTVEIKVNGQPAGGAGINLDDWVRRSI